MYGALCAAEMVDVKNKRCEADGCMKRGLFGYDGERARFCGGHRLEGPVRLPASNVKPCRFSCIIHYPINSLELCWYIVAPRAKRNETKLGTCTVQ